MDDETPVSASLPGHLIRRLHQLSTQVFAHRIKEAGSDITPVQFAALDSLQARPGIDQATLAGLIAKDRATIGGVVDRLEQKGLLARTVSADDKRARVLTLTPEGQATIERLLPVVQAMQREILPGLTAAEYDQFITLMTKAAQAADDG